MDRRIMLKVKIKSLAAEARIIRREEHRSIRHKRELSDHRKGVVREESRHTQLAYGFIRGRSYCALEARTYRAPDWARVRKMVDRYGVMYDRDNMTYSEWTVAKKDQTKRFDEWTPDEPNS